MGGVDGKKWTLWIDNGTEVKLAQSNVLNRNLTFVWDDRIILHPADKLKINAEAGSNFDIFYSYIDQDWT